jgi:hypothetical protein
MKADSATRPVRVELPAPLLRHAKITTGHELTLAVPEPITLRSVLDALEAAHPTLRGTIRDHATQDRRPFLRFFACSEDLSHQSPDTPRPPPVAEGRGPLLIIGAIAGG